VGTGVAAFVDIFTLSVGFETDNPSVEREYLRVVGFVPYL
jgi:hypothetical protein